MASTLLPIAALLLGSAFLLMAGAFRRAGEQISTACAALLAAIAGWLMLMLTTSDVGLTMHLGIVLAALARSAAGLAAARQETPAATSPVVDRRQGLQPTAHVTASTSTSPAR
jgi:hypothetical protein